MDVWQHLVRWLTVCGWYCKVTVNKQWGWSSKLWFNSLMQHQQELVHGGLNLRAAFKKKSFKRLQQKHIINVLFFDNPKVLRCLELAVSIKLVQNRKRKLERYAINKPGKLAFWHQRPFFAKLSLIVSIVNEFVILASCFTCFAS